jgi:uncharacterized protein YdhG (YjbR/CyaY superfamily)
MRTHFATVDEYFAALSEPSRSVLQALRGIVRALVPNAVETISYQMPTLVEGKVRLYFAGYAKHVGYYPGAAVIEAFASELKDFKTSKGTVQFPLDQPLPAELIRRMTLLRLGRE